MKTKISLILLAVFAMIGCASDDSQPQPDPIDPLPVETVVYLIRHAEKADSSVNTDLSAAGLERANNWAVLLDDIAFDAFYSTNYNRTLQTIDPIATHNEKEVTLYNPASFSLDDVIEDHEGKNVFIVGHSNTIPDLINAYLGEDNYPHMEETEFGNLYKIRIVDGMVSHEMTVHN